MGGRTKTYGKMNSKVYPEKGVKTLEEVHEQLSSSDNNNLRLEDESIDDEPSDYVVPSSATDDGFESLNRNKRVRHQAL